jgi:hypothetical protein
MVNTKQRDVSVLATIASARVAGELYRASVVARKLSLAAKNSRAMVLRAGSMAAGLQVISEYFAELASSTISLSELINAQTILISRISVRQWRQQTLNTKLTTCINAANAQQISELTQRLEVSENTLAEMKQDFMKGMRGLENYLEEIQGLVRSSSVVAVNFRLEATQTGEFQPQLNSMADDIESLSNQIRDYLENSLKHLNRIRG